MTGRRSSSPRALARVLFPEAGIPVTNMQYIALRLTGDYSVLYRRFLERESSPEAHLVEQELFQGIL